MCRVYIEKDACLVNVFLESVIINSEVLRDVFITEAVGQQLKGLYLAVAQDTGAVHSASTFSILSRGAVSLVSTARLNIRCRLRGASTGRRPAKTGLRAPRLSGASRVKYCTIPYSLNL